MLVDGLENYKSSCDPDDTGGQTCGWDEDNDFCFDKCTIPGETLERLIKNHTIPCKNNLRIGWTGVEGAQEYDVYVRELNSDVVSVRHANSSFYQDLTLVNHDSRPLVLNVAVRGEGACGGSVRKLV